MLWSLYTYYSPFIPSFLFYFHYVDVLDSKILKQRTVRAISSVISQIFGDGKSQTSKWQPFPWFTWKRSCCWYWPSLLSTADGTGVIIAQTEIHVSVCQWPSWWYNAQTHTGKMVIKQETHIGEMDDLVLARANRTSWLTQTEADEELWNSAERLTKEFLQHNF